MSDKWKQAFLAKRSILKLVVREEREQDLISSPVFMLFTGSAKHYDCHNNMGRNESSSLENALEIRLIDDE